MALSPNYGWAEPDNSSLVKNGAQDIRALGDAIDTSVWNVGYGQAGKNKIINGNFTVWQRGTSLTTNGYIADRWTLNHDVNPTSFTQSQQTFTPGAAPVAGYEGSFFWRYAITTLGSGSGVYFNQRIEDVRTFAAQPVTISFWAKANAATTIGATVQQNFGSGGSGGTSTFFGSSSVTTSWTRFSVTATMPSISGKTVGTSSFLQMYLSWTPTASQTVDIWGVQVEYGSKATPFQTASGGSPQAELAMCQRYFERMVNGADNSSETIGVFQCFSTTQGYGTLRFVVPKRATPSMTFSGNADFVVKDASGTNRATTLMATGTYSPRTANVTFTIGTASLVAGSAAWMLANSATATIDVSAEL
jgi:hypothetical protein